MTKYYYSITGRLIVVLILIKTTVTSSDDINNDLQSQNQDHLNPLTDYEYDYPATKDQDKRTIIANNINNYGWAKHVGLHPSGFKYVLGYGPVDLKYVPVARPIAVRPHAPTRWPPAKKPGRLVPFNRQPVNAFSQPDGGWRPLINHHQPALPINVPAPPPPHHQLTKPWQQSSEWKQHHHVVPIKPSKPLIPIVQQTVVPVRPVALPIHNPHPYPSVPVAAHPLPVHHVHPLPIPRPVQVAHHPVAIPRPIQVAPIAPVQPLYPSPLFEVTKPNLPVLPLGAVFQSPVLQPSVAQFGGPYRPAPGASIEYHGTHNYVVPLGTHQPQPALIPANPHRYLPNQVPLHNVLQQFPQHAAAGFHPHLFHPQIPTSQPHNPFHPQGPAQQIPHEQHDVQTPLIPANHPLFSQQSTAFDHQANNELQLHHQQQQYLIEQQQHEQHQQFLEQHQHSNEQHQHLGLIQPGQTDLQLPLHLPQHPNYLPPTNSGGGPNQFQSEDFRGVSEGVFKPSISLEPPFTHK